MKKDCHMVAKRIAKIILCDRLSKDFDLSEYRITMESFREFSDLRGSSPQ